MSFKLFFASTFGLIKSTAKIEKAYEAILADYRMFSEFEKSKEHKEYHELEVLVNSPTFKHLKRSTNYSRIHHEILSKGKANLNP